MSQLVAAEHRISTETQTGFVARRAAMMASTRSCQTFDRGRARLLLRRRYRSPVFGLQTPSTTLRPRARRGPPLPDLPRT